jgi:ABC-type multidrug transport system ATPase subunit
MNIILEQIGKRFQQNILFKNLTYRFESGKAYALLGINGSGKSTLMRIIAGMQTPSVGKVRFEDAQQKPIPAADVYRQIAFSAPGMDIIDELTLEEFLRFHFSFKPLLPHISLREIPAIIGLAHAQNRLIGDFSSGMKQRVKLAQAIFADTSVLLLDEPCTNLDQAGVRQYAEWINAYAPNRLVIVASNDEREYFFCTHLLAVKDYAPTVPV